MKIGFVLLLHTFAKLGFSSLISDATNVGTFLTVHSFVHLDLAIPAFDIINHESLPSLQGFFRSDTPPSSCSLSRSGILMLFSDLARSGFFFLPQSLACLDLRLSVHARMKMEFPLSTLDYAEMPPENLQGMGRMESLLLVLGMSCSDSSLLVLDLLNLGLFALLQSLARLGHGVPVLKFSEPGASSLARTVMQLGLLLLVLGKFVQRDGVWNIGNFLLIFRTATLESMFSAYSEAWLEGQLFVLDLAFLDSLLPIRNPGCIDLVMSAAGLCCVGSLAFVLDMCLAGSFLPLRSHARHGTALPALALSRLGASTSTTDVGRVGSVLPVRSFTQLEPVLLTCCSVSLDSFLSALDSLQLDLLLPLRSLSCADPSASPVHTMHLGLFIFPQGPARANFLLILPGTSRSGFVFSTCGVVKVDFLSPLRKFGHADLALLLLCSARAESLPLPPDLLHPDPLLFIHSFKHFEFSTPLLGKSRIGALFLTLSGWNTGSFSPLRNAACLEFNLPSLDVSFLGSSPSISKFARTGFPFFALGKALLGTSPFCLEKFHIDFLVSSHGFVQLDSLVLASKVAESESALSLKVLGCSGFVSSVLKATRFDFSFFMLDCSHFEPLLSVRGAVCSGPFLSMLNFASMGFPLSVQKSERCASNLSIFGRS